jgi:hypothetical protein
MKIDPEGKKRLETVLLNNYADAPLRAALFDESGETVTVQLPNKQIRFRLTPIAKDVLQGKQTRWMEGEPFFLRIEE